MELSGSALKRWFFLPTIKQNSPEEDSMKMSGFMIQCLAGHSAELPEGHSLVEKCEKRKADRYLDALCVSDDECAQCLLDAIEELRRSIMHYSIFANSDKDHELLDQERRDLVNLQQKFYELELTVAH